MADFAGFRPFSIGNNRYFEKTNRQLFATICPRLIFYNRGLRYGIIGISKLKAASNARS